MDEPSLRTSRLAITGGLVAAIAIASGGFVLGRITSSPSEPQPVAQQPTPIATPPPPTIEAPRLLRRADIIALADRAADALTAGAQLPADVADAVGKRFDILLPFGCAGPAPEESTTPLRWRYNPDQQTLRIHVAPTRWEAKDWGIAQANDDETFFKGFWVSRPWSSAEQCPQARGQAAPLNGQPVTLPGETLALAEMLPKAEPDRDRPYETVQRMAREEFTAGQGFWLRLTGRVERFLSHQPVKCIQPAGIEQRPICLLAVSFDEVRIDNPANGNILATWSMRSPSR